MVRQLARALVFLALVSAAGALAVGRVGVPWLGADGEGAFAEALTVVAILAGAIGTYRLVLGYVASHAADKRRHHDAPSSDWDSGSSPRSRRSAR